MSYQVGGITDYGPEMDLALREATLANVNTKTALVPAAYLRQRGTDLRQELELAEECAITKLNGILEERADVDKAYIVNMKRLAAGESSMWTRLNKQIMDRLQDKLAQAQYYAERLDDVTMYVDWSGENPQCLDFINRRRRILFSLADEQAFGGT